MTARPLLMHANSIDVLGPGMHASPTPGALGDTENMPLLGTGGSIDRVVASRRAQMPGALPLEPASRPAPQTPGVWGGAPPRGARQEPAPFARYFGPQTPRASAAAASPSGAAMAHVQTQPPVPPAVLPPAPPSTTQRSSILNRPQAPTVASVPALQIASSGRAATPSPQFARAPSSVLPSFAFDGHEDINSALPAISMPLQPVSSSAQARALGPRAPHRGHNIFYLAAHDNALMLEHHLTQHPDAITLWHPEGDNLLHHVVRQRSVAHVDVVLRAMQRLPLHARIALLDGVANDGLDAVRIAIKQHSAFVLAKLLEAGCDPTRQRYRHKPGFMARMARPLQPYWRVENAALYAMRKHNVDAVDLLLLWDERRIAHPAAPLFAFELEALMGIATSIDRARLRNAMIDVLHAARRRRPQPY